jgi:DNA end-binding protein Ku
MKTMWHGTISFGLVSVPVGLAKAQDRQGVSFRQVHAGCGERVRQPKVCPLHGELTMDQIARGYETEDGTIFEVPDGEIEAGRPDASKVIEVKGFVTVGEINPIARDKTYYLLPAKEKSAREGYVLLVEAMARTQRAALASFVLWGRENLCTVRCDGNRLLLDILYYAEDIRDPAPVDLMTDDVKVADDAVDLAVQIIQNETLTWDHGAYFSEYRERLRETLDAMVAGRPVKKAKAVPAKKDTDLLAALKASVEAASKSAEPKKKSTTRRKATAGGRAK